MQNYLIQNENYDFIKCILGNIARWYKHIRDYCYYCTHFKYNGDTLPNQSEDIHLFSLKYNTKIITYHYDISDGGIKIVYT